MGSVEDSLVDRSVVFGCVIGSRAVSDSEGTFDCCLEAWNLKYNAHVEALRPERQREIVMNYIHL